MCPVGESTFVKVGSKEVKLIAADDKRQYTVGIINFYSDIMSTLDVYLLGLTVCSNEDGSWGKLNGQLIFQGKTRACLPKVNPK